MFKISTRRLSLALATRLCLLTPVSRGPRRRGFFLGWATALPTGATSISDLSWVKSVFIESYSSISTHLHGIKDLDTRGYTDTGLLTQYKAINSVLKQKPPVAIRPCFRLFRAVIFLERFTKFNCSKLCILLDLKKKSFNCFYFSLQEVIINQITPLLRGLVNTLILKVSGDRLRFFLNYCAPFVSECKGQNWHS